MTTDSKPRGGWPLRLLGVANMFIALPAMPMAVLVAITHGIASGQHLIPRRPDTIFMAACMQLMLLGMLGFFASGVLLYAFRSYKGLVVAFFSLMAYLLGKTGLVWIQGAWMMPKRWWLWALPVVSGGYIFFALYVLVLLVFFIREREKMRAAMK